MGLFIKYFFNFNIYTGFMWQPKSGGRNPNLKALSPIK